MGLSLKHSCKPAWQCNLMQKIQKGTVYQFFKKREKPSIWDHFGYFKSENNKKRHFIGLFWSLFANKVQNEIIFKKSGSIYFVQFHAKIQKISMSSSKEKLWTNRQMDSWYFIGRSHCGFKNKKWDNYRLHYWNGVRNIIRDKISLSCMFKSLTRVHKNLG